MKRAGCGWPDGARAIVRWCLSLLCAFALGGLGCHGSDGPASTAAGDAAAPDGMPIPGESDGPLAPRPEVRAGLVSGAPCQSSTQCQSGACTLGVCSDWSSVLRITIDTTGSGANVKEAVTDFPLLVRLDDSFDFDSARSDGADLRFLDAAGHTLAYEIERWDPEQGAARIWVLVPTVEGNSSASSILMYFGNPTAVSLSSGPAVFSGFGCVLHALRSPDGSSTQMVDSSGHANTGLVQAQPKIQFLGDGIAADGIVLDGNGTYVPTSLRLPGPHTFTTSLWFKTDSNAGGGLLAFSLSQAGDSSRFDRAVWMDTQGRLSFGISRENQLSVLKTLSAYNDGGWHLVAARFSSAGQYLMVDGESVSDDPTSTSVDSYTGYWRFGEAPILSLPVSEDDAIADDNFIAGAVDEMRVSPEALGDAWVKLSWATERPGSTAVTYQMVP